MSENVITVLKQHNKTLKPAKRLKYNEFRRFSIFEHSLSVIRHLTQDYSETTEQNLMKFEYVVQK